jgi:predicted negative regulator of RcsB-dependent stress response
MRRCWGGIAGFLLYLSGTEGARAAPVDCGPAPNVKCVATEVFSLAKTLPDDSYFRRHVAFAEQQLAPGDLKTALEYVVSDNPDPSPWEDIEWMARAGRFDPAIKLARQRKAPVERLGGLLAVAEHLLDRNDNARAQKIVEEVERALPSLAGDSDDYAALVPQDVGELWARLGQIDRSARLIAGAGTGSVERLLAIAEKYPAAASLREQAWGEAERVKEFSAWQALVEDAIKRGDQAEISGAAQRVGTAMAGATDSDSPDYAIRLARVLLTAGSPELAATLVKPWPQWVNGKDPTTQYNVLLSLIPVLVGLTRDQDVEAATHAVSSFSYRAQCMSIAAAEYFRIGRSDVATRFDREALFAAALPATGEPKAQWDRDAALQNVALARADHGNIQGALDAVAKLADGAQVGGALYYVVRRAIDNGHGPVVGPAIEAMEQVARTTEAAGVLLQAANYWYEIGEEKEARRSLAEAMKMAEEHRTPLDANQLGTAAELTWRLDGAGKAESIIGIVDRLGVNDPGAINRLVEIVTPMSPAVALQLTGRLSEVEPQIDELAGVGIEIAGGAK